MLIFRARAFVKSFAPLLLSHCRRVCIFTAFCWLLRCTWKFISCEFSNFVFTFSSFCMVCVVCTLSLPQYRVAVTFLAIIHLSIGAHNGLEHKYIVQCTKYSTSKASIQRKAMGKDRRRKTLKMTRVYMCFFFNIQHTKCNYRKWTFLSYDK